MYPKYVIVIFIATFVFHVVTANPKDGAELRQKRGLTSNNRCDNLTKRIQGDCSSECGTYCGYQDCNGQCSGTWCSCVDK